MAERMGAEVFLRSRSLYISRVPIVRESSKIGFVVIGYDVTGIWRRALDGESSEIELIDDDGLMRLRRLPG